MTKQSDILVEHLRSEIGKNEVDIYPLVNAFALDVICGIKFKLVQISNASNKLVNRDFNGSEGECASRSQLGICSICKKVGIWTVKSIHMRY